MIIIRLKKISIKKKFSYEIVVSSPKVSPTSSKLLERIGYYKPIQDKWSNKYFVIDVDRLLFWLYRGGKLDKSFLLFKPLLFTILEDSKEIII